MATGERTFSSQGVEVQKFDRTPPAVGDYDFVLKSQGAAVKSAQEPGSVPYVGGVRFELLDSSPGEGQANKSVFNSFFLSLKPGSDGKVMPQRQNGVVALARALGEELEGIGLVSFQAQIMNKEKGQDGQTVKTGTGEFETIDILNPEDVKNWLAERDGKQGKLRVKHRKGKDGAQAEVDYFIEADPSQVASFGSSEETEPEPEPEPVKPAAKAPVKNGAAHKAPPPAKGKAAPSKGARR